ncbi:MAG: prolyl-tRNA synthetase associated domain-containing protein [Candidatus Puniceispirillales bacterium]
MTVPLPYHPNDLMAVLEELGIVVAKFSHPPLRTVEDSQAYRQGMQGGHAKNLYLRDRKKRNYLVVAEETQPIDLKVLATAMEADRLTFGSPDRLMQYLGVIPGAVTPFSVINDQAGEVTVFLDETLANMEKANFHPLVNDQTVTIAISDLMRFFSYTGHSVTILPLQKLMK